MMRRIFDFIHRSTIWNLQISRKARSNQLRKQHQSQSKGRIITKNKSIFLIKMIMHLNRLRISKNNNYYQNLQKYQEWSYYKMIERNIKTNLISNNNKIRISIKIKNSSLEFAHQYLRQYHHQVDSLRSNHANQKNILWDKRYYNNNNNNLNKFRTYQDLRLHHLVIAQNAFQLLGRYLKKYLMLQVILQGLTVQVRDYHFLIINNHLKQVKKSNMVYHSSVHQQEMDKSVSVVVIISILHQVHLNQIKSKEIMRNNHFRSHLAL